MGRLSTILLDVGGTIIPEVEQLPSAERERSRDQIRLARRSRLIDAGLTDEQSEELLVRLVAMAPAIETSLEHHPLTEIGRLLVEIGAGGVSAIAALDAVAIPLTDTRAAFRGTRSFLERMRARGLRVVVVSNTIWGTTERLREDFSTLGIAELIDGIVTNADVVARKPDPRIFVAAIHAAGDPDPAACVMVGDHERKDVEGASAMGFRTIRIAPEGTPSAADAVAPDLAFAASIIDAWSYEGDHGA